MAPGQLDKDPVGRPLKHVSAEKQVTGEAIYCDDIPKYEGENVLFAMSMFLVVYFNIKSQNYDNDVCIVLNCWTLLYLWKIISATLVSFAMFTTNIK